MSVTTTDLWRIEAVNPSINAATVVLGEQAVEAAKAADRAVAAGGDNGDEQNKLGINDCPRGR